MREAEFYREKIIGVVQDMDDSTYLSRLYKLIQVTLHIENRWLMQQVYKFIDNIMK